MEIRARGAKRIFFGENLGITSPRTTIKNVEKYTYIDLFSGCGGLSLGLHQSGWKGLFAIEKNKDAFKTLHFNLIEKLKHFDWVDWLPMQAWDINQVLLTFEAQLKSMQGKVDMIAGGPPCQGFSVAGRRKEGDVRNGLIKSYLEFVGLVKPKIIFFENVKGFTLKFEKNKTEGSVYARFVEEELEKLDYEVKGEMVNFSDFGVPQKRTRFILVGIRKDLCLSGRKSAADFFQLLKSDRLGFLSKNGLSTSKTSLGEAISDLLQSNGLTDTPDRRGFSSGVYGGQKSAYQKLLRKGYSFEIPDSHSFANHRSETVERYQTILRDCKRNKGLDKSDLQRLKLSKHTIIPLHGSEPAPTLTTIPEDFVHYAEPRVLTVREYARVQSFPDWFEFKGKYTTGGKLRKVDVPRYTQIGNAIPPLFGEQSGLVLSKLLQNG